ncbi:hypothetical protein BGX34_002586 [Mortierella sp. NVP85]|nr:hypothetical protein BGX34_002586 [Mortierella sp. NVP85]
MTKHATELPELRQHIARYLNFGTLKACTLVCKAWHLDLHSVLWRRFSYKDPESLSKSPEEYATWLDITSRKAHLFQHICHKEYRRPTAPEIRDILLDQCHGLITIEAFVTGVGAWGLVRNWEEILWPLIEQNKASLRKLQLREVLSSSVMTSLHLPNLLSDLSRLQSLDLEMTSTLEDLLPILDACPNSLKFLLLRSHIQRRKVYQESSAPDQQQSPSQSIIHQAATTTTPPLRLKHLGIYGCYNGTLWDVLSRIAAHSLESLQVNDIINSPSSLQVFPALRDTLSRLTDLHIERRRPKHDPLLPMILAALPPQQLRNLHLGTMDTECTTMLTDRQHQSLESLHVGFVRDHGGALGDILATCSKLKSLEFRTEPFVDIRTLTDSQKPWVCTELEVFKGSFGLSPFPFPLASNENHGVGGPKQEDEEGDEKVTAIYPVASDSVEGLFMQQVGRLTKLRRLAQSLDKTAHYYLDDIEGVEGVESKDIMKWTLSSGLTHLADLVNLEWLEFIGADLPKGIGPPEFLFIKRHWPNLRGFTCYSVDSVQAQVWLAIQWPESRVEMQMNVHSRLGH